MNKIKNIIALGVFSLMVMALPSIASAQWGGNNGGYYPNGGNNNGGRYGGNLENVADRLKDRSRDFERQVDREFNYNRNRSGNIIGTILGGGTYGNRGYGNDNIKRLAEDFRRAANDFENRTDNDDNNNGRYGRNSQWGRGDSRDQQAAQRLLSIGSQLENELRRMRMSSTLQYQWNAIRQDLNIVANAYGNGRGGRNGRNPF
ncbi:MAG: hypothetical protein ACJ72Z_05695 [Pyrinomonadaceae bacterium]